MNDHTTSRRLPTNVKLLGWASLLNDVASEMIFPLLPRFLISVLGGSRLQLGAIEGAADSASSLVKLWSGGRSDRGGQTYEYNLFANGDAPAGTNAITTAPVFRNPATYDFRSRPDQPAVAGPYAAAGDIPPGIEWWLRKRAAESL
ncbi:MAG: hypothetical protein Q7S40_17040 [Opitutaceae bacterium]|nr:hypothetical protein [Opitutaceae bacterium]